MTANLQEIASRISAHLRRFESSPETNPTDRVYKTRPFYCSGAYCPPRGRRIRVTYVSYQGASQLTREEAERYLAWLDAGNVGKHHKVPE